MDELFEVMTWSQLGIHSKPCGLLNVCGYYDKLMDFLRHIKGEGFISGKTLDGIFCESSPAKMLDTFASWSPSDYDKAKAALKERAIKERES